MLEVSDLAVSYGRHQALDGVNLRVEKGEICVILGANGAGKSTLLKAIAGMVRAGRGSVVMNGRNISGMKAHRIVEEGIALVPEGRGIFGELTVAENLQLGSYAARARSHEAAMLAEVYRLFPRLAERKRQVVRTMSGGEQQMVTIGRALMSRPEILMLDEPSLGLSPLLTQELFRALKEVAETGVGILLVEQNARQSLKISDRGYLIENGHVTGESSAEAMMNNPDVINAYLGGVGSKDAGKPRPQGWISATVQEGLGAVERAVEQLAIRAGRIQALFIRALRRERPIPSAFVGLYDPSKEEPPMNIAVERPVPIVSADARALSARAEEFADRASRRLALHIAATRGGQSAPISSDAREISNRASDFARQAAERLSAHMAKQRKPELQDAEEQDKFEDELSHPLIGHNSRFAEEEDEPATEEPKPVPNGHWSVADGIGALVAELSAKQSEQWQARTRNKTAWPVSDGIASLVAEAAGQQKVSNALRGKDLTAYSVKSGSWPVTGNIAMLIEQAQSSVAKKPDDAKSK